MNGRHHEDYILWIDIALSQICMIIINIFCPVASILGYAYFKPWFHVAIVMYNSCSFNFSLAHIGIIAKAQNMPTSVEGVSPFPKSNEARWQSPQLP